MSLPWFRFYREALYDLKVQRLTGPAFKNWVNCLCLARGCGGVLPGVPEIAYALRIDESHAQTVIEELQEAGLLDCTEAGLIPHNWDTRQCRSDSSRDRTREWRERKRHSDVTVTGQNRTEQIQNTEAIRASPEGYAPVTSPVDKPPFGTTEAGALFPIESQGKAEGPRGHSKELTQQQEGWFAAWWPAYWRRTAKKAAREAFRKQVTTEARFQTVMVATGAQAAEMLARAIEKRPHPATWLNGERWEDEIRSPPLETAAAREDLPSASKRPVYFDPSKVTRGL